MEQATQDKIDELKKKVEELEEELKKSSIQPNWRGHVFQKGDKYWTVNQRGVLERTWAEDSSDLQAQAMGLAFPTEGSAEQYVANQKFINKLWKEDGVVLKPDWGGDGDSMLFSIHYDHGHNRFIVFSNISMQKLGCVLPNFKTRDHAEKVIKAYERELKDLLDY